MMQIDEFIELARTRRSIRRFKFDPVPDEYLEKILEAARWAMSGANGQPWQFIVIKDQETKNQMAEIGLRYSTTAGVAETSRVSEYRHRQAEWATGVHPIYWKDAPVIIAVLGDIRTVMASVVAGGFNFRHVYEQNMGNVTHMIHLATAALGLGAQWVSIWMSFSEVLKPILGVPAILDIFTLVPIGYPAYEPTSYRRKLSELVSYEKYDMSKFRSDNDVMEFIRHLRERQKAAKAYPHPEDQD
ncbi:MAG: nitroreductase family protein [Deltaproteobacteria bacterium]|nr:MAG: nitroreductase family protein [Deltaproteobacteria bacterium]